MRNFLFGIISPICGGVYLLYNPTNLPIWFGLTLTQSQFLAGVMLVGGLIYLASWLVDWLFEKYFS